MSKPEGIYLSTDYRVTDSRTGDLIDDAAIKSLHLLYPPIDGGPKALLAYTGLAILPDGTDMGVWIRETLRGEDETFEQSMAHLRTRLDRDVGHLKFPLMINILIVQGDRRYLACFSNIELIGPTKQEVVADSFGYMRQELHEGVAFANGSGATRAIADGHLGLMRSQLGVRPRATYEHMKLLAAVNRRVAAKDKTVSPFCQVNFINADDQTSPAGRAFVESGESAPFEMPTVIFGLDLTGMARRTYEKLLEVREGSEPSHDSEDDSRFNEEQKRRP